MFFPCIFWRGRLSCRRTMKKRSPLSRPISPASHRPRRARPKCRHFCRCRSCAGAPFPPRCGKPLCRIPRVPTLAIYQFLRRTVASVFALLYFSTIWRLLIHSASSSLVWLQPEPSDKCITSTRLSTLPMLNSSKEPQSTWKELIKCTSHPRPLSSTEKVNFCFGPVTT